MRLLLVLIVTFGVAEPAFAYIDPGTGSILLQGLLAAVVGALAMLKIYWKKISSTMARLFGRRQSSDLE